MMAAGCKCKIKSFLPLPAWTVILVRRFPVPDWTNPGCSTTIKYRPGSISAIVNSPSASLIAEYCATPRPCSPGSGSPFNCTFAFRIGDPSGSCKTLPWMLGFETCSGGFACFAQAAGTRMRQNAMIASFTKDLLALLLRKAPNCSYTTTVLTLLSLENRVEILQIATVNTLTQN